jgi:DNA-binding NtrC family response regulator
MRGVIAQLARFAASEANVLVTGETGAGKDVVAHALHRLSGRARAPFVTVDCPGLPASLLEAELFGHERGAFTDATSARAGRFELAGRGTIYLDRVHELPLDLQAKLLRLVEHKQVERLGATHPVAVHARIVASADDRIEDAVAEGAFRGDLYHRLRVLPLHVPPLRERRADLPALARRFLAEAAHRIDPRRPPPTLTRAARERLLAYHWPGNVRELRHVLERSVLSASGTTIDAADLPIELSQDPDDVLEAAARGRRPTLDELERRYIAQTLEHVRGSQTRAATLLGISRKALWEKRKRFGLG